MAKAPEMTETEHLEAESLPHSIAAAGLQVSQAADELREAAERLMRAEEQALEAEARARTAEEQLEQGATKNAELLEMLAAAREGQAEADERRRQAEERLAKAVAEGREAREQAKGRLDQAQKELKDAEGRAQVAEERLELLAAQNAELLSLVERAQESKADGAEEARQAEQRLAAEAERAQALEQEIRELEARLDEAGVAQHVTVIVDDEERSMLKESVAAEVRRPLTSILGLALALKHADASSPDGKDMIKQLATSARKLDRLVGQMLDLDKLADGTLVPNRRRTNVEALVRRVIDESQELAKRDVHIEAEHVAVGVDPHLAEQMIDALLANAAKRTVSGNPVWVKIEADQGGVVISVDDTGPEVPAGLRTAMFASLGGEGSDGSPPKGVTGLSLLARLAEIHGGRAWVEERQGGGASFRVLICDEEGVRPQRERHLHAVARVPETDGASVDATSNGHKETSEADDEELSGADIGKLLTS